MFSAREIELLSATMQVLGETGYDRLTIDEVAARAHASKATVYRRWPSKGELVVAAMSEGLRHVAVPPNTGTLRGDLLKLAELIAEQGRLHGDALAGVLSEVRRNPRLEGVIARDFIHKRRALIHAVLHQAVVRGEIRPEAISDDLWDLLPGYLMFRSLVPGRPPTPQTLQALVDDVLLPSLTRDRAGHPSP